MILTTSFSQLNIEYYVFEILQNTMSSKYYTILCLELLIVIYIQFYAFNINKDKQSSHCSMHFNVTDNEMRHNYSE